MRIMMESVNELFDILMDNRVIGNVVRPVRQLGFRGKLAIKNKIGRLQISTLLRDLFDRIATIAQNAFVPIYIRYPALAGSRVHETRVVTDQALIIADFNLEQVRRLDRSVLDGY